MVNKKSYYNSTTQTPVHTPQFNPTNEIFKPDDNSKVLNPETKRWITRGGKVYNSLVSRGVIIPKF